MSAESLVWNHPLLFWIRLENGSEKTHQLSRFRDCAVGDPPLIDEKEWRPREFHEMPIRLEEITDGYFMCCLMEFMQVEKSMAQ